MIAANVNRLLPAKRSLVWTACTVRTLEAQQIYKLCSGLLGRPCLSGERPNLMKSQWRRVNDALDLYRKGPRLPS